MSKEMIQNIRLHKETKCQAQEKTGSSFKEREMHSPFFKIYNGKECRATTTTKKKNRKKCERTIGKEWDVFCARQH